VKTLDFFALLAPSSIACCTTLRLSPLAGRYKSTKVPGFNSAITGWL
jgi:hypothetical protein